MKEAQLKTYVGKSIQLKFRGDSRELGPGKLEQIPIITASDDGEVTTYSGTFFRLNVEAMMGDPRQPQAQTRVTLPLDFDAEEVVWVSEGPKNAEGDKLVHDIAPAGEKRTGGGIVIPGR